MKDSDTLLVGEWHRTSKYYWLVALSRSGSEWRETHRLQLHVTSNNSLHLCALSDSRVLCGQYRLDVFGAAASGCRSGERRARRVSAPPRRHRRVQLLLGDVRQRRARRHVLLERTSRCGCIDCATSSRSRNSRASIWRDQSNSCGSPIDCSSPNAMDFQSPSWQ